MVLMRRKDIIEQYGIDPLAKPDEGGLSVVPKNVGGPTAAINVDEGTEVPDPPSNETESAGLGSSMLAGAFKSVTSDPAMLAGLGYGVYYWAKKKALGEDAPFAEGLYAENGLQTVQKHIDEKMKQVKADNPNMNDAAVRQAIEDYTATPEFFEFNTSQMIAPLRNGMRMANQINQKTGVNKTPDQENMTDDAMQMLGGILNPIGGAISPFLKTATSFAGKVGGKVAENTAKTAATILDYTVVPGVVKPTVGNIAGNVAGGMVVDEAIRNVTGDPSIIGGDGLQEWFKDQEAIPAETLPTQQLNDVPVSEQAQLDGLSPEDRAAVVDYMRTNKSEASIGATGAIAAAVAAVLGGRRALRGRVAPTIPPANPSTFMEDLSVKRAAETGLNDDPGLGPLTRPAQWIDEKTNTNAPLEQLGRELGVEEAVTTDVSQYITPRGREAVSHNFFNSGIVTNGTQVEPPRVLFDLAAASDPNDVAMASRAIAAENVMRNTDQKRLDATAAMNDANAIARANPNDPALQQAAVDATTQNRLWANYDPQVRRYLPEVDEQELQAARMNITPGAQEIIDTYKRVNRSIAELRYRSGVDSLDQYNERITNDHHMGMFEASQVGRYNPREMRSESIDDPTLRVHNPISPLASMKLKAEASARYVAEQVGKRGVTRTLQAADPTGREIRIVPQGEVANEQLGKTYTYMSQGREVTVQVSRADVANAINQSALDRGAALNFISSVRSMAQFGMVHGFAALGQTPISLLYDLITGYVGQRAGTSFGYLSRFVRQANILMFNNSAFGNKAADIVDIIDLPTRALALGVNLAQVTFLKTVGYVGEKMMLQAITRDGFFGHIARTPTARRAMGQLGRRMSQHFWSSWMGAYKVFEGTTPHEMLADFTTNSDAYLKSVREWEAGTPRGALPVARSMFRGYIAALDTIGSLARTTYFAQNYAIQGTGRSTGRPLRSQTRLMAERARTYSGDMAAQPGGKVLQYASAAVPFFRIGLQSFRYIVHAMTSRGAWDSSNVIGRMGMLGAAMYGTAEMMEEMGLQDWYYEQLNDFERIGKFRIPNMDLVLEYAKTGVWNVDKENPDNNFRTIQMPQEISLFMTGIMYGLEQMGFVNRGSNRGNTSAEKDMLYAAASTFSVGQIPFINAMANPFLEKKVDFTAGLRGRAAVSDIKGSRAQDGDMASGIPMPVAEAIKSLLGFNGQLAVQMVDAGAQSFQKGKGLSEALRRGTEEGVEIFKEKSLPTIPGLWQAKDKVYGTSALSNEIQRQIGVTKSLANMYSNEFTPAGQTRGAERLRVLDPDTRKMLYYTNSFFNRGNLPKIQERITLKLNEIDNLRSSKGKLSYQEVTAQTEKLNIELRPLRDRMYTIIERYEGMLADKFGEKFKQEGLPPTVDSVAQLVNKYKGKAPQ